MTPLYSPQSGNRHFQKVSIVLIIALLLMAATIAARPKRSEDGLKRGQYRVTVVKRSSVNGAEGGSLRLSISEKEKGSIPVVVMHDGSSVSGNIEPGSRDTKTSCTVDVVPHIVNQEVSSDLTVVTEKVTTQKSWLGNSKQESRVKATSQISLSEKPFRWTAESGVHSQGTVITLGTVEGKPVRLRVGYSATKP